MATTPEDAWATDVLAKVKAAIPNLQDLFTPPFGMAELFLVLRTVLSAVEHTLAGPARGADKKKAALAVLKKLDEQYHWKQRLDDLIPLPGPLEWVDDMAIPIVEGLLVDLVVQALNTTQGWIPMATTADPPPATA